MFSTERSTRTGKRSGSTTGLAELTRPGRVLVITDPPNAQGVYRAKVEILDPSTNTWVAKGPSSSFFPDAWTPSEVSLSIQEAYSNIVLTSGKYWEGIASNGVRIGGYLDANGNIATAFPIY